MNTAIDITDAPLEVVIETILDHNQLIEHFKTLGMPMLEHINTCSGIAIQELNSNSEDMLEFFAEFNQIYGFNDEELVVEQIAELESTTNMSDRKEAMYLKRWLAKQKKFGLYV